MILCKEFGRSGTLCGQCDKERNYYPRAYSFDLSCTQCDGSMPSNLWKYIACAYLPLTVFYLLVFFIKLDIHYSQLYGFVIFSQLISTPVFVRVLLLATREIPVLFKMAKLLLAFYGVWNLEFLKTYSSSVCFRISFVSTILLDLGVAVYPVVLMLVTYSLLQLYDFNCRPVVLLFTPFQNLIKRWYGKFSAKKSLVKAFATFTFLCASKLFNICCDILTPVRVYQFTTPNHINISLRLHYDSTIEYFSSEHAWCFSIAAVTLSVIVILPTLIALLYYLRIFHKLFNKFPPHCLLYLHTFVDSLQGSYRDGTEPGRRDCRLFGPIANITQVLLLVVYS